MHLKQSRFKKYINKSRSGHHTATVREFTKSGFPGTVVFKDVKLSNPLAANASADDFIRRQMAIMGRGI